MSKIDDYLAKVLSAEKRTALGKLRKTIRSIVPGAEECVSYGMPAYRLDGAVIAGFQATANGCHAGAHVWWQDRRGLRFAQRHPGPRPDRRAPPSPAARSPDREHHVRSSLGDPRLLIVHHEGYLVVGLRRLSGTMVMMN